MKLAQSRKLKIRAEYFWLWSSQHCRIAQWGCYIGGHLSRSKWWKLDMKSPLFRIQPGIILKWTWLGECVQIESISSDPASLNLQPPLKWFHYLDLWNLTYLPLLLPKACKLLLRSARYSKNNCPVSCFCLKYQTFTLQKIVGITYNFSLVIFQMKFFVHLIS